MADNGRIKLTILAEAIMFPEHRFEIQVWDGNHPCLVNSLCFFKQTRIFNDFPGKYTSSCALLQRYKKLPLHS